MTRSELTAMKSELADSGLTMLDVRHHMPNHSRAGWDPSKPMDYSRFVHIMNGRRPTPEGFLERFRAAVEMARAEEIRKAEDRIRSLQTTGVVA